MGEAMSDTPRTTSVSFSLRTRAFSSRGARRSRLEENQAIIWRASMLATLLLGLCLLTGCEALLDIVPEIPAEAPELAGTEATATVVAGEAVSLEPASEWPWASHDLVVADASEMTLTDARTGEPLGRINVARDANSVDVLKSGDRTALRFSIRGTLDSSEPVALEGKYGQRLGTIRRMQDGRFLVKALEDSTKAPDSDIVLMPVPGTGRKRESSSNDPRVSRSNTEPNADKGNGIFRRPSEPSTGSTSEASGWHYFSHEPDVGSLQRKPYASQATSPTTAHGTESRSTCAPTVGWRRFGADGGTCSGSSKWKHFSELR